MPTYSRNERLVHIYEAHFMHITTALAFFCILAVPACASDKIYTKGAKLTCNTSSIEVLSMCKLHPGLERPVCIKQEFKFNHDGKISIVTNNEPSGNRITYDPNDLWYTATEWACVSGKKNSYVMVLYNRATDGNCEECETYSVYDLNGGEVIPKFDPNARDTKKRLGLSNRRPPFTEIPRRIID